MARNVILMFVITTPLCGCGGQESKTPDQPTASPPVKAVEARPPVDKPSARQPAKPAVAAPLAEKPSSKPSAEMSDLGEYASFPACGIKIRQPDGFEKSDTFDGFGEPETQSSIMAVSLPGPYSQISAGFSKEQIKSRGWVLRSRDEVTINGLPGILVHFEQPAGDQVFLKWSFVFGNDQKTTMVTATFPKEHEQVLSARLKSAVLSLQPDQSTPPDPGADLAFTLVASPKLKLSPGINRTLVYSKDGKAMLKSPGDPLFVAAPSIGVAIIGDERKFAEQRLLGTVHTKNLQVKSVDAITIDGLDGFRIARRGRGRLIRNAACHLPGRAV